MARVLIINPPSPEQLGAPLLGLQYVASALLAHGCEVKIIDAAARYYEGDFDSIVAEAERFAPDVVGFSLFSRWVWHAYRLVERFSGRFPLLFAGGAHTTVLAEETLEHGFDVAIEGEAEDPFVRLIDSLGHPEDFGQIAGVVYRASDGTIRRGPPAKLVENLDDLPLPLESQSLFDPKWYHPSGNETIPGGILSSRGCPARCTFCANYVTGRSFRHRSSASVVEELNLYHERFGTTFFPFWDDALTTNKPRLFELCEAIERDIEFDLKWSAITRANMVSPELVQAMRRAGCVSLNFGVESGDNEILRAIKKGITIEFVVRALTMAKDEGMLTACNFMLGFPQETPESLGRTLAFMQRIEPMVDSFSTLGVLVPFPGTPLYDDYHVEHGFTDWWLREECSHYSKPPPIDDFDRFYRHYIDDTNLELDFFHYSNEMRAMIKECLRFKGEHNLAKMGLMRDPVFRPEPALAGVGAA
ncbi:MAG: B12-binding domain-containing radical SAM protein [Fimbriimonas ginsengisoli]|uniref:B12-binding domain-containing radical SAM protein n=1 Tax=Fimbriimonas ginsengisoli TaxID=1005039 RepID=A0A931PUZ5_FIMGI|nr:B12-binding domain-containing radical SAM protein [Fimbriimonas ginsengisoli]